MARRDSRPKTTAWDRVSAKKSGETLANRDVYQDQQLDRSTIAARQTKTSRLIGSVLIGLFTAVAVWGGFSAGHLVYDESRSMLDAAQAPVFVEAERISTTKYCYRVLGEDGEPAPELPCFPSEAEALDNPPSWVGEDLAAQEAQIAAGQASRPQGFMGYLRWFGPLKAMASLFCGLMAFGLLYTVLMRNLDAQNLMHDTTDINQYSGDQRIALPQEIIRKFDWFPDAGAHSAVQPSSMISHVMLRNKGLKKVQVSRRAPEDLLDADGEVEYLKGEVLRDGDDAYITDSMPMIDEEFGDDLFETSGLPDEPSLRQRFDARAVPYNPDGSDRDKNGEHKSVADMINADWILPAYEVQRPAGAYIVDTAPVNTMVLAITRAGKGQTYIEPMIDMWLREKRPNNMIINDPKGELLVKHYVRATMRGYQVVQFNLINAMKTDIYNPLGMAAEAAREGDSTKCALYVENIADVFFPLDGGDDPVWPNAANNAFKRAAYGLIDYYLEEERELRAHAIRTEMDPKILDKMLDERWGKVTLYNCYQLFVQLTAKKSKNPVKDLEERLKDGEFGDPATEDFLEVDYLLAKSKAQAQEFMWEDKPEIDMLTLFFNATAGLPRNSNRTLVANADNALRAMGAAEKMLASVYGIAITAMSFFTDPTISTLTSGTPSQNTDLGGLSFPRRMGVRFGTNYLKRDHLIGTQVKWDAYADPGFTESLGKDFEHEDIVSREGWARYYFVGKFGGDVAYLRLRLVNAQSGMLVRTLYFRFTKDYQTSLNGRFFVTDPVTGSKIIKNGILLELKKGEDGTFAPGHTTYPHMRLVDISTNDPKKEMSTTNAVIQTMVRYSESPKAVFLVTPPHLMKYAKLVLILVKQLVDLNFDKSYMTKEDQKPLYKTRFMLDELGNLQSEGHGISGFETMLSIGLGQEQQFTLILQTLQQLRDVYGESVDKIVQGNCLPLDARIATPTGWTTMGQIQEGEELLTPFGTVTKVTDKYAEKVRPVYRLTLRDGSSVEACPDHLWPVERWVSALKYTGGQDEQGRRLYTGTGLEGTTAERRQETISTEDLKARIERGRHVDLIAIEPVAYREQHMPVDPYVLGAVLGDAHIDARGGVFFYCDDPEVVGEIRRRGYDVVRYEVAQGLCPKYAINGIRHHMRDLGVAGQRAWEKLVPEQYLFGSVEQRVDLLRGLMDTDGTISAQGEMEFCSSSQQLASDVQTLVRSLGGRVAVNVKAKVFYTSPNQVELKAGRPAYRVQNIRLPKINPFVLVRKAERWRDRTRGFNRVVSVEYMRDDVVQCIRVADERHLYLTGDFIPTHNTSNIVFLKSTDDSMIETLEKMSGTRHVAYTDSKTITKDTEAVIKLGNVEGKVSYTMSTKEEPVIKYNDMAFISERNSIVFRAGDSPVWNRNELILPMSWRLFKDDIVHPGHEYSLQTIPTLSSALDFDVRMNQPDFEKMLAKRMAQAVEAVDCVRKYKFAYGYEDVDVARLDPDVYSEEVMELVDAASRESFAAVHGISDPYAVDPETIDSSALPPASEENLEVMAEGRAAVARAQELRTLRYAGQQVSKEMLVNPNGGGLVRSLDAEIVESYRAVRAYLERDREHFSVSSDGSLRSADGASVYISVLDESSALRSLHEASAQGSSRVFAEQEDPGLGAQISATHEVHEAFYVFLASLDTWQGLGDGEFDWAMSRAMQAD